MYMEIKINKVQMIKYISAKSIYTKAKGYDVTLAVINSGM